MTNRTPSSGPSQQAMAAILACGMSTAVELVAARGLDHALTAVGSTVQETLTADEMGILTSAVALILAQREAAPADLSTLPAVELAPCPDPACLICWGAVS